MARIRSAMKKDVPLRTPRRKISPLPASLRIVAPSLSIRLAICLSLNAFLILFFNRNLVPLALSRDLEGLGDLHACQQDDLAVPQHERNPVAEFARNFTINQEILQLFLVAHAEGLETVAFAAVADDEFRVAARWELELLPVASGRLPVDPNRFPNLRNVRRIPLPKLDF